MGGKYSEVGYAALLLKKEKGAHAASTNLLYFLLIDPASRILRLAAPSPFA